jgi:4-hydroxythreonine-4-phosphate dehydrogenase
LQEKEKLMSHSFRTAVFECLHIIDRRKDFEESHKNPLKKITSAILANQER